jgi:hypothetical protein
MISVEKRLAPGQFLRHAFPRARVDSGTFVKGLSADDFEKLMNKASEGDPCTEAAFFSNSDGMLATLMQSTAGTLNSFPVGGYLEYWGKGESYTRIPVTGVGFIRQAAPPCPAPGQASKTKNN